MELQIEFSNFKWRASFVRLWLDVQKTLDLTKRVPFHETVSEIISRGLEVWIMLHTHTPANICKIRLEDRKYLYKTSYTVSSLPTCGKSSRETFGAHPYSQPYRVARSIRNEEIGTYVRTVGAEMQRSGGHGGQHR